MIEPGACVIDSDFRGNVKVVLHNLFDRQAEFETGDRTAQVVFKKVECPTFSEVSNFDDFIIERNKHGFGSTEAKQIQQ